ncbi:MAG: hypothetical protein ABW003_16630 [Microvirga sp.]
MEYNRQDRSRLKRVQLLSERALDHLSRAHGEMRPLQFAGFREPLGKVIRDLENVLNEIEKQLQPQPRLHLEEDSEGEAA